MSGASSVLDGAPNRAAHSIPSPCEAGERVASIEDASRVRGYLMRGPNRKIAGRSRELRTNATDAETKLWFAVRDRRLAGYKFVRQKSIGPYIVDFVCRDRKVIVEVDGGQHAESARDQVRDAYLASEGYRVLRFWNSDVLGNISGVLETILASIDSSGE